MHPVPLIGNGDIYTHLDAERARESGVQTLMVRQHRPHGPLTLP